MCAQVLSASQDPILAVQSDGKEHYAYALCSTKVTSSVA